MKKINALILITSLAGSALLAAEAPRTPDGAGRTNGPAAVNTVAAAPATSGSDGAAPTAEAAAPAMAAAPAAADATNAAALPSASSGGTNCLRLNFRGAPLDKVLSYLSEAAGFIIVLEAQPRGRVDVWSDTPVTKQEAVDLLNSVLNKNGYAAIRKGRTLTIVNKDEAKTKAIPVRLGSDPENIDDTDEMVTQIIPVRFVEVGQLIKDLQPLVSPQTAMTANESGNSIVITDTQCNIRRVAEIIKAIDGGAEDVTVVKVFHLTHANPTEMSDLLTSLFPDDSRSGGSQAPVRFGGFGGFRRFFGGFGGGPGGAPGGSNTGGGQDARIKKRARVIAVPDQRTASVVVTATKDLMDQIGQVVQELDSDPSNLKSVAVFRLENAEPQDAMQVLQDIFQKNGTPNNRNAQNQNNALNTRSTQQTQQYNNSRRTGTGVGVGGNRMGFGQ